MKATLSKKQKANLPTLIFLFVASTILFFIAFKSHSRFALLPAMTFLVLGIIYWVFMAAQKDNDKQK